MSLIWALMVLETAITEQFFEVQAYDKNNKPAVLERLDYGLGNFSNTLSLYGNEKDKNNYSALPLYIDSEKLDGQPANYYQDRDVADLEEQGWTFL